MLNDRQEVDLAAVPRLSILEMRGHPLKWRHADELSQVGQHRQLASRIENLINMAALLLVTPNWRNLVAIISSFVLVSIVRRLRAWHRLRHTQGPFWAAFSHW